ncbi:hypothetical protein QYE76_010141 [Lolium multiflorum]|uniref:CCHC-type domain-containing protein n=1 Tax=Lolium multiflorum TaxID=4521 RepID=A0AAD8TWN1_LOLMU|nr:hypothetical protein QYE76_010141 [Lolium multiflorum]
MFMIREGESVADAYGRLGALRVKVKGLGVEKYNDGFEMNEAFIKSKVIAMIGVKQEDTNLALNLQIITKTSHNLALKARANHGREEVYEIEEDEEMTSTSDIATDFTFFAKKYKAKFPMLLNEKKKKRTCYNCDEDSHFTNECPYEKRVDKPKAPDPRPLFPYAAPPLAQPIAADCSPELQPPRRLQPSSAAALAGHLPRHHHPPHRRAPPHPVVASAAAGYHRSRRPLAL